MQIKMHVDDWLDNIGYTSNRDEAYARLFLEIFRMPAVKKLCMLQFVEFPIHCKYQCEAFRLTGASRLGDVWLRRNLQEDTGYDLRVDISDVSDWVVQWGERG